MSTRRIAAGANLRAGRASQVQTASQLGRSARTSRGTRSPASRRKLYEWRTTG